MPKIKFTDAKIRKLKLPDGSKQRDWFELLFEGRSLILTVNLSGKRSWSALFYDKGKPRRKKLGEYPALSVKDARKAAREFDAQGAISSAKAGSFKEVAEKWFEKHVVANALRSESEIRRHLERYVYPKWEKKPFREIRRGEVNDLLDDIAKNSRAQADAVLATVRSIMNWYQSRDDDYISPVVPKMKRDRRRPEERARNRILDDDEIKDVWNAADELGGSFGAIVQLCLLTGQRRAKIASIKWTDIDDDGVWTIASEDREKGTGERLKLPQVALDIIEAQPTLAGNPYVFAAPKRKTKATYFNSWSQRKAELDKKLGSMPHWTIHDLRRTCRSLMSRIGVSSEVAERTIGHKRGGVEAIYDRHTYEAEKADALLRVSVQIDKILKPDAKVVPFPR